MAAAPLATTPSPDSPGGPGVARTNGELRRLESLRAATPQPPHEPPPQPLHPENLYAARSRGRLLQLARAPHLLLRIVLDEDEAFFDGDNVVGVANLAGGML